ncbi:MAG: phosphatidate cytidylyltransferase [Candidatus Coatesbacteria bacterium]|nr:MAG: phosphatidate cytidylyltransferase [Candidatus Coatesbacteria bacterium]
MNPLRYITAAVWVPVHLAIIWFGKPVHLLIYFGLLIVVGSLEMFGLLEKKGARPYRLTVLVFGLILITAVTFAYGTVVYVLATFAVAVTIGAVFRRDNAGALGDTAATILSFVYPGALLAFLIAIGGLESGRVYLVILFLAIWATDTGAYFAGKAFGRHALAPRISPKKSIEGLVGGAAACLAAVLVMTRLVWPDVSFGYGWSLSLAAILVAGSVLGDLTESVFKRDAGEKDSGWVLPGHGGVLDRFDGVFVCAPAVYVLIQAHNFYVGK